VSEHFFSEGATMNGKWLAGVALGVVIGLAAATVGWHARADGQAVQVQRPARQHWEYQVLWSQTSGTASAGPMTAEYNGLAKDGWEYVGPIVHTTYGQTVAYTGGVYVLFKRSK
jgi:hypothetical protein